MDVAAAASVAALARVSPPPSGGVAVNPLTDFLVPTFASFFFSLTRWDLQEVLMEVWAKSSVTAVCVTHDVDEAILLADRIVPLTPGGPGAGASLGPPFPVTFERPRDRASLNFDPRFKQLGVIASMQALFAMPDATVLTNYAVLLGPERASRAK